MESDLRATTLYDKALACLLGGLVGDAMGTPSEGIHYREIQERFGWIDDFEGSGTDDTVMKDLLSQALVATGGYATLDDWAQAWLDDWQAIFGPKVNKFFISVLHTAQKVRRHSLPRMAALGNMPSSSSAMAISPVGIVNACNPRQAALQAYNLASLIHTHDVAFCTDGAAAMAAAVAAALLPGADVNAVDGMGLTVLDRQLHRQIHDVINYLATGGAHYSTPPVPVPAELELTEDEAVEVIKEHLGESDDLQYFLEAEDVDFGRILPVRELGCIPIDND